MAISFPASPSTNDVYQYNAIKYVYDGVKWVASGKSFFDLNTGLLSDGTVTANAATVTNDLTVDTDTLYVDSTNNRVGLGISSPTSQLHLSEAGGTTIKLGTSQNTSEIEAREDGGANLLVLSSNNSADHLTIDSDGNVGIGTSDPGTTLELVAEEPIITLSSEGFLATDGNLNFENNFDASTVSAEINSYWFGRKVSSIRFANGDDGVNKDNGSIAFRTQSSLLDLSTRMSIEFNGDVRWLDSSSNEKVKIFGDKNKLLVGGGAEDPGLGNTNTGVQLSGNQITASRDSSACGSFNRVGGNGNTVIFRKDGTNVGSVSVTASATSYNTSSDYRLKENVVPMTGAADRIKDLKPSRFNFIVEPDETVDGFLAHEVQTIVPESVIGEKDAVDEDGNPEYQAIDQSKLVPLLTGALQEALAEIDALKARLDAAGL